MKKLILLLMALFLLIPVVAMTSCEQEEEPVAHVHTWQEATCTVPKTCTSCGATEGTAVGHATPNAAGDCTVCGTHLCDHAQTDIQRQSVDPTCGKDGIKYTIRICKACGVEVSRKTDVLPATNEHTYDWISDETSHHQKCSVCSATTAPAQHVDGDSNGLCDSCGYGEEIIPTKYYNVILKTVYNGLNATVKTIKVEENTALTEEQIAEIESALYLGFGFKSWAYEDGTPFDKTATITADVVIIGERGDLAGAEITWAYDADTKTLTFTGSGAMFDFVNPAAVPWSAYDIAKVVIDEKITSIGDYTFYVNALDTTKGLHLAAITLPEGLERIGKYSFYGENLLTEVVFPESLKVIDENAFRACAGLTHIDIGGKNLELVAEGAFAACSSAKSVVFNGAIDGSSSVFETCDKLTHAYFAGNKGQYESVEIGFGNQALELAFLFYFAEHEPQKAGPYWYRNKDTGAPAQWCYSIYYIPSDGIKTPIARDYVFVKSPTITVDNLDFRDNIWYNGYQFAGWDGEFKVGEKLTKDVKFNGSRGAKVGDSAEYQISGDTLYIVNSGKMWDFAKVNAAPWYEDSNFENTSIKYIHIAPEVTYIGDYAFCTFPNLEAINIESNIVEMSTKAFYACSNLKYVYYHGNELEAMNCKGLNYQENVEKLVVYCKEMQIDGICDTCGEVICDHVDENTDNVCDKCENDFCAHVDENADGKCDIQTCKKTICVHTDRDVSFLTEKGIIPTIRYWKDVEIQTGVNEETGAPIISVNRITWEYNNGVLVIGGQGVIPDTVDGVMTPWVATFDMVCKEESLGFAPIEEAVTSVVVRDGITAIGSNAFFGLNAAASIELPAMGITRIAGDAFDGTAFIKDETNYNADGLFLIGNYLIKVKADVAERVLLPNELLCVADDAFAGCESVKEIRVPKTVVGANTASFAGLNALEKIFFHGTNIDLINNANLNAALPETAQVYYFTTSEPTVCGYYWKSLLNPEIYEAWIPANMHASETLEKKQVEVTPPTCTVPGSAEIRCPHCDYLFETVEIPATGIHTYEDGICTGCSAVCEHTETEEKTTDATCSAAGKTDTVCKECEKVTGTVEIPATGVHTYEDGVCAVCGATEQTTEPEVPNPEETPAA